MKTVATASVVERSGVQAESTFTIKATSKAFDILSSGLYSDKVRAIVRELSCNAHDSHVAAGKADLPIEVKLPSSLDQTFYVKDFGTGLSHEDIIQIYTTYFESTKTESDDFIGQLGLGSKSPFSYAPTFTVESRHNGVRRVYTCFKNEQGMPAISLMGEVETDEPNGLTVALAVKRDDIDKFNDAARKVYMYFDPVPKVLGYSHFEPYRIQHTIKGTNWKIRSTDYSARMTGPYVVQGFVAYPLDGGILAERDLSEQALKLLKTNLDITVGIGQVEVAASREALSYDKRTIDNLVVVVEQIADEMYSSFQAEFDKCATPWEAAQMYGKFSYTGDYEFRSIFEAMHRDKPFQWNGKDVNTKVDMDLSTVVATKLSTMTTGYRGQVTTSGSWTPENANKTLTYDVSKEQMYVLVDKEAKGHHEVVRTFLTGDKSNGRAVLIAPISKKLYNQAEIDHIINELGNPPVVYADTLNVQRTKAAAARKRTAEQKLVWQGFPVKTDVYGRKEKREKFSRLCWATETVVLEDGGYYIDLDRHEAQYKGTMFNKLDELIERAVELGYLDTGVKIYGIQKNDQKHIADIGDWVNVVDYVKEQFAADNQGNRLFNRTIVDSVKSTLASGVVNLFIDKDAYIGQLNDGKFKTVIDKIRKMERSAPDTNSRAVRNLASLIGIADPTHTSSESVLTEWRKAVGHYGMLRIVNWAALDVHTVNDVINYINLVDAV